MTEGVAFACPTCHSVVLRLNEVRYAIGLHDVPPRWICNQCLDELRGAERAYAAGEGGEGVWAIEIIRVRGDAGRAVEAARSAPRPRSKTRRAAGAISV